MKVFSLIMAGGCGTRLWPESTSKKPKQYLSFIGDESLIEQTLNRFENLSEKRNSYVVTTEDQANLVKDCSKKALEQDNLIIEPEGRDTGPCILLSLAFLESRGAKDSDVISVMPSDHIILNKSGFQNSFEKAVKLCQETSSITTIGISPSYPHTGYGYIQVGEGINDLGFKVKRFKEKPSLDTATNYLKEGSYYWNAGMFMATLGTFKREFSRCAPTLYKHYNTLKSTIDTNGLNTAYSSLEKISIDYALMEKSSNITLVRADFDWNDLGSWEAMQAVAQRTFNNFILKSSDGFYKDSQENIVFAPGKFVALNGVNNKVIVINDKVALIMDKSKSQEVKHIVDYLKEQNPDLV